MPKSFAPSVVTANALLEGDVVYLTDDRHWTRHLAQAVVLTDESLAQARLIEAAARADEVVGVYLAEVAPTAAGPQPTHFREDFRRTGPSNYAHGKQESTDV